MFDIDLTLTVWPLVTVRSFSSSPSRRTTTRAC